MIELGKISINDETSIVEARNKIHLLAKDLNFTPIEAERLAIITSEFSRIIYSKDGEPGIVAGFEKKGKSFGLVLIFRCKSSKLNIGSAPVFFDETDTFYTEDGFQGVKAFKYIPDITFKPGKEFIDKEKEKLLRLSRAELMSEVKRKNEELMEYIAELKNEKAKIEMMAEELKELDQLKSDLVSTVSHELRTPLTSITGYIDLILDGDAGEISDLQKEFLEIVKRNTDRLGTLINDFLDIQRLESGRIKMNLEQTSISDIVQDACKSVEPVLKEKGLAFYKEIEPAIAASVDRDRILQVAFNLLSNAVKYTDSGSVKLTLRREDGKAIISVKDTGVGMTEADQKKLFSKFFRADNEVVRKAGGTGLGLAITKKIVEAHKGKIWVKSEFGKGSEFIVELPIKK